MAKDTALISITVEQHARLKALAKKDKRSMRGVLDVMMDMYEKAMEVR